MKHALIICFFLASFAGLPARAAVEPNVGEGYAVPTFKEMYQTIILMRGMNINDQQVVDEYARLTRCPLYREHYKNDVAWNRIGKEIVARVLERKESARVLYETFGVFQLERYDFQGQYFPLTPKTAMTNVGTIVLLSSKDFEPYCRSNNPSPLLPPNVNLLLNQPLTINKVRVPPETVEKILARMDKAGNPERYVYGRIRFLVTDAPGLVFTNKKATRSELLGRVTAVDFFLDREMTKPLGRTQLIMEKE